MSWTFLLKVWPLFRCSRMAAFGCSLRKLEAADHAIEMRRLELDSPANPDSLELAELRDGLNTLRALGFLKGSNGAIANR
jgi:hypothetical protein